MPVVKDYEHFIAWVAHIAQKPDVKIGWCPLFMSEQGTGKGLVLGTLLPNIFDKLVLARDELQLRCGKISIVSSFARF